ncbi:MAG: MOSC domain-containing protein [Candidatus Kapabacteria bacterium]|nr:MOSC domain-containing protein [Candidatus Kapabacteria bacterium]
MGKIIAISISTIRGIPKTNVVEANLIENFGIEQDAHAGDWHRQISLLADESIDKIRNAGMPEVSAGDFAENLTTKGIDFSKIQVGTRLSLSSSILLEITQIGKECHTRCKIYQKVGNCVMPTDGLFAKVLKGGKLTIDDDIEIL